MRRTRLSIVVLLAMLVAVQTGNMQGKDKGPQEPDHVVVQHCLIGFKKSVPNKSLDRTKREAQDLAEKLLALAESGEDFDAIVEEYTNDRSPGILRIANDGVPRKDAKEYPRNGLAARFGDAAFEIEVGQFALVRYHPQTAPYGWHVMKRLE